MATVPATDPRPGKPESVLVIGSGPIVIGQAAEFDYAGTQACRALREEGIRTILVNSNPATIMTDEDVADAVYIEPLTPDVIRRVIQRERPEGLLPTLGGQTGLNLAVQVAELGILEQYNVRMLGTPLEAIRMAEDRALFRDLLERIGEPIIPSAIVHSVEEARAFMQEVPLPLVIRPAYTLGGTGGGIAYTEDDLDRIVTSGLNASPIHQVLVDRSLLGWKEIEYEVMRDSADTCITICNMENFDPLGIHTGESIVVAPSQTLSNSEYHKLRSLAIKIIRHLGVVGECNVQYALDPNSEDYRVIEVNARLSRSSALASKATGYPLAFVAAKLGVGYGLHQLKNSVTQTTTACFEPALDYVVVKIPRWDLNKFHGVNREIGSSMKSVGEIMAIGRSFEEAIQKGLRMVGQGMHGLVGNLKLNFENLEEALTHPTDQRIFAVADALEQGWTIEKIHLLTRIDPWFLEKLANIISFKHELEGLKSLESVNQEKMLEAKQKGFSDFQLARFLFNPSPSEIETIQLKVRNHR